LFGFLFWQTDGFLTSRVDEWLVRESDSFSSRDPAEIRRRLDARMQAGPIPERPIALFDPAKIRLAGSEIDLPNPVPTNAAPFEFVAPSEPADIPFRGIVRQLPSGNILLVAQDISEVHEFSEVLVRAMILGGLVTTGVGLAGAAFVGARAVRQIDAITQATGKIMMGDLSSRLPSRRNAGDVDRLVDVVNRMLDEIERLMREVKGVCDNIAHDLRTPLTRILAGLERGRRRAVSADEYAVYVDDAIFETKSVLRTFNALLRISEVEDGARRAGFTDVDLAAIVADSVEFYDPVAEDKGVALRYSVDGASPPRMLGDPGLLFEAVGNLIDNALKFTPTGGRVSVTVFGGLSVGLTVADTGPGILPEEHDAVIRRFYRTEKSRHEPGNGLGLSLVAAIARLHGMNLEIANGRPGCSITIERSPEQSG
jgi:signal transduction histidine kinase